MDRESDVVNTLGLEGHSVIYGDLSVSNLSDQELAEGVERLRFIVNEGLTLADSLGLDDAGLFLSRALDAIPSI